MANKKYITLKVVNSVLALYGVELIKNKTYDWFNRVFLDEYFVGILGDRGLPYRWEQPKTRIPDNITTNQQRLEYILDNLDKINPS